MRKSDKITNKDIKDLNIIKQSNLINMTRRPHPSATKYRSFSSAHGTFTKREHMLGREINLINFKGLKSYSICFLSTTEINNDI